MLSPNNRPQEPLTKSERLIASLVAQSAPTNRAIAEQLGVSEATVKGHMTGILGKLELANRAQLVLYVMQGGAL